MRILLFGGFLGSGKTTIIGKFICAAQEDSSSKIAVIENEMGKFGVDNLLLGSAEVKVTQIFGGCVCCQVTGSLIEAIRNIEREQNPDWLVIEMSGIAYLSGMKETLREYLPEDFSVETIAVLDASRWKILLKTAENLIENQVIGSDIIIVNKCDLVTDPSFVEEDAVKIADTDRILRFYNNPEDGQKLWNALYREERWEP